LEIFWVLLAYTPVPRKTRLSLEYVVALVLYSR
jgi:hypothetical protein